MRTVAASPLQLVDGFRRAWYRALGVGLCRFLAERERRVAVLGVAAVTLLFLATCFAPALLLVWGPLVVGVPHVAADVRYLVVRPWSSRLAWIAAAPALAATWIWPHAWVGLLAPAAALLVAPGSPVKRGAGVLVALLLAAVAWQVGYTADLTFAYLHNVVALGLFWAWAPRRGRLHFLPLACVLGFGALLALGVAGDADLARFLPGPTWLVQLFAFTQAVHYFVWLRLIPEQDRPRPTPRSWRGSLRALVKDLGWPLVLCFTGATIFIFVWGVIDAEVARVGYLRAVLFHGHLEVVAAALLWVGGRRPVAR